MTIGARTGRTLAMTPTGFATTRCFFFDLLPTGLPRLGASSSGSESSQGCCGRPTSMTAAGCHSSSLEFLMLRFFAQDWHHRSTWLMAETVIVLRVHLDLSPPPHPPHTDTDTPTHKPNSFCK